MNGGPYCGDEPYEGLDSELERADSECGKNVHIGSDLLFVEFVFEFLFAQNSIPSRRGKYPVKDNPENIQCAKHNSPNDLVGIRVICPAKVRNQSDDPDDESDSANCIK